MQAYHWFYRADGGILGNPELVTYYDDKNYLQVLYVNSLDGNLYAFEASQGYLLFTFNTNSSISSGLFSMRSNDMTFRIDKPGFNDIIYLGNQNGILYAINVSFYSNNLNYSNNTPYVPISNNSSDIPDDISDISDIIKFKSHVPSFLPTVSLAPTNVNVTSSILYISSVNLSSNFFDSTINIITVIIVSIISLSILYYYKNKSINNFKFNKVYISAEEADLSEIEDQNFDKKIKVKAKSNSGSSIYNKSSKIHSAENLNIADMDDTVFDKNVKVKSKSNLSSFVYNKSPKVHLVEEI